MVAVDDDLDTSLSAKKARTANLAVAGLTLSYGLAFVDRSIFNILLDPIKKEFALSDTTLGLISGFGFVLLYASLGLFVGRLADSVNRVRMLSIALAFWSLMTAATAFALSVGHIVLFRLGVAVGESALQGPAHSLIADYFPKAKRPRALAIYAIGPYLGTFLGFVSAGVISQYYGWRMAFLAAGLPGIILAALLYFFIAEPARGGSELRPVTSRLSTAGETIRFLFSQRTFVLCLIGFCMTAYTNFALSSWIPSFLRRVYNLNGAEVGLYAGIISGVGGILGSVLGGFLIDRVSSRKESLRLLIPAAASALGGIVLLVFYFANSLPVGLLGLVVGLFLVAVHVGPVYAAVQSVVKIRMRSVAASIVILGSSLFGNGLAPFVIGFLNDRLAPSFGAAAIRYSLITATVTSLLGAIFLAIASRSLKADSERALQDQGQD